MTVVSWILTEKILIRTIGITQRLRNFTTEYFNSLYGGNCRTIWTHLEDNELNSLYYKKIFNLSKDKYNHLIALKKYNVFHYIYYSQNIFNFQYDIKDYSISNNVTWAQIKIFYYIFTKFHIKTWINQQYKELQTNGFLSNNCM